MSSTVIPAVSRVTDAPPPLEKMLFEVMSARFTPDWSDRDASIAAYLRHNEAVRAHVPGERLVGMATRRRMGAALPGARHSRSSRALPAREHNRRVPSRDRARTAHRLTVGADPRSGIRVPPVTSARR